jgi:hypothetical protein
VRPICASVLAIVLVARAAAAEDESTWGFMPRGHVAYGIGGAIGELPGFRQGLDASFGVAAQRGAGNVWLAGGSVVTGFGAYPTYLSLDLGHVFAFRTGDHDVFYGGFFTLGPALRVDPGLRAGAEASVTYTLVYFELGLRALVVGGSGAVDGQLEATIGLGVL